MRRTLLLVAVLLAAIAAPVQTSGASTPGAASPELAAQAWYLLGEDGTVLADRNATERRAIASITKLMTAVVTLERVGLSQLVTVRPRSSRIGESSIHLQAGDEVRVAELVRAMLVPSANDAADALAAHVGRGSVARFVGLMNAKARELGLDETSFVNPHGLDAPGHVSSAKDATLLLRYSLGIPFIRDALDRSSVTFGGRTFKSTDGLRESWAPALGGKTGHTAEAGWSEAAAARARGVTVYGAVLGSRTEEARDASLKELLSYGLARYRRIAAVDASRVYATVETGYGRPDVDLVAPRTVVRTVHERRALVERVVAPGVAALPVEAGDRLGRVEVWSGNRLVASANLVAASSVSEPGMFGKAAWYAERTAVNLWGLVT